MPPTSDTCYQPGQPDEFDEWPDEFLLLGITEQDVTFAPDSGTTTSETVTTDATEDASDTDEDIWPLEML